MIYVENGKIKYGGTFEDVMTNYLQLSYRMVDIVKEMTDCSDECARDIAVMALRHSERRIEKNGIELDN